MLFGIWRIFDYSKLGRMLNNETTGTGSKATKRRHDEEEPVQTETNGLEWKYCTETSPKPRSQLPLHSGDYPALAPAQREDLASPRTCSTPYKEFLR